MHSLNLSFYQVNVQVESGDGKIIEELRRDFSFFSKNGKKEDHHVDLVIHAHLSAPSYDNLPPMQASYISPKKSCYYSNGLKYVDYAGKALVIYSKKKSTCDIYTDNFQLLHDICYMVILALASEQLDKLGIHRVHALALASNNNAFLILLDRGGGKSTLAVQVLNSNHHLKLISEDSPLIDSRGSILPFPLRFALFPDDIPPSISPTYLRSFMGEGLDPKALIDIDCFTDHIQTSALKPSIVMIGRRVVGKKAEIRASSKYQALKAFIKNSVVGVGLNQGIEFIFEKGPQEVFRKIPLAVSRLKNSWKVIHRCQIFEFLLSPDKEKNTQVLIDFVSLHLRE